MAKAVSEAKIEEKKVEKAEVIENRTDAQDYVTLNFKGLTLPWAIFLSVIVFTAGMGSALYFGLKARPVVTQTGTTVTPTPNQDPTALSNFPEVTIPFVNGPTNGDKNAKVVVLEFSDLVCPYCKKFHDEAYKTVFNDYIATGKARLVYKHYPLSFHNPAATLAAKASYCIETLAGEEKMFAFTDAFFAQTSTLTAQGGTSTAPLINIVDKKFYAMISGLGVDSTKIKNCMKSAEATARLESDAAEMTKFQNDLIAKGTSQGLGTPSFVVGVVQNGVLSGRLIEGAYPAGAFKNVIEEQLKK